MDMIDLMPPGLYEAVITAADDAVEHPELVQGDYLFSLETRTLEDIRALGGNSPEDDLRFAAAARVSEINQRLYRTVLSPAVRMAVNEQSAEFSPPHAPQPSALSNLCRREPIHDASCSMGASGRRQPPPGEPR
jgi:hypothetical protein